MLIMFLGIIYVNSQVDYLSYYYYDLFLSSQGDQEKFHLSYLKSPLIGFPHLLELT
jgi:hypothetical protein